MREAKWPNGLKLGRWLSWEITHIRKVFEVLVLRPESRFVSHRGCVNDAVCQRQRMARSLQRQRTVQVDKLATLHHAGDLERVILTPRSRRTFLKTS